MSFELDYLVSNAEAQPTPDELRQKVIEFIPNVEVTDGGARGALWHADYWNSETMVPFTINCRKPNSSVINFCARESGLSVIVPSPAPTFIAREVMPILADFAKKAGLWIYTSDGRLLEKADGAQLQMFWTNMTKRVLNRMSSNGEALPYTFTLEQMDGMWKYHNARHQLTKRYDGRNIQVPRVSIIRNKLSRNQVFRATYWTELSPTVLPDVDALVINKPGKLIFGRFPAGEIEAVVANISTIWDIIEGSVKKAPRPFEHNIIEDTNSLRLPIFKRLMDGLQLKFKNFETLNPEEVIDMTI